jgi:hypothetical protein
MTRRSVLLPAPPKDKKEQLMIIAAEKGRI